jgi:iron donor protein CyaY
MDPQEFERLADTCIAKVADWLESFDPDEIDYSTADGVVSLEFPGGVKFILNRQAGNHQMWYAAGVRAYHYNWNAERGLWLDDRDEHELFGNVSRTVSEKIGREVGIGA